SSERAALARYQKLAGSEPDSLITFKELVNRALAGEPDARTALVDMALCLGIGISNLVVGFSPEAVVVSGKIARAWPLVEEALKQKIEHSIRRGIPSVRILPSTLGNDPTLMGALSLVLVSKFAASAFAA
ncbi:MAG TPA: ROK family protein, partial [Pyrinomonadaceae bacterium]